MAELAALAPLGASLFTPAGIGAAAAVAGAGATVAAASANKPKLPTPQPTVRMPDLQSPEVMEARRKRIAERQAAGGRESTILTDDNYSNTLLGQ